MVTPILAQNDAGFTILVVAFTILLIIIAGFIYFLPTFVAFSGKHPNRWLIFVLNLCLGITLIVWLICLVWAYRKIHINPKSIAISHDDESDPNIFANDINPLQIVSQETAKEARCQNTVVNDLAKLNDLRERGILNSEEFEAAKKKLLF